eukprot:2530678-Rhodomonas_salina.1
MMTTTTTTTTTTMIMMTMVMMTMMTMMSCFVGHDDAEPHACMRVNSHSVPLQQGHFLVWKHAASQKSLLHTYTPHAISPQIPQGWPRTAALPYRRS